MTYGLISNENDDRMRVRISHAVLLHSSPARNTQVRQICRSQILQGSFKMPDVKF